MRLTLGAPAAMVAQLTLGESVAVDGACLTVIRWADDWFEVDASADRLVAFAGWADKFQQVAGNTNPVATAHFNFSFPEPVGLVALLSSQKSPLLGLISGIAPIIVSGNAVVAVVDNAAPMVAIALAEVLATSDLPAGVVNILTGLRSELFVQAGTHMDVDAVFAIGGAPEETKQLQIDAAEAVKELVRLLHDEAKVLA